MHVLKKQLLDSEEVDYLCHVIKKGDEWLSGKTSAGGIAGKVKENFQYKRDTDISLTVSQYVFDKLLKNEDINSFVKPAIYLPVFLSKTEVGGKYGNHVDHPYMSEGNRLFRTDLSFTLSLTDPDSYDGGDLVIKQESASLPIRLNKGEVIIYPTTSIHQVTEVTRGTRYAVVGWVTSMVPDSEDRYCLYKLKNVQMHLDGNPDNDQIQLDLVHIIANLTRKYSR